MHISIGICLISAAQKRFSVSKKNPQYVFFLVRQQEMQQISAGTYNVLKTTRRSKGNMPVHEFLAMLSPLHMYSMHGDRTLLGCDL